MHKCTLDQDLVRRPRGASDNMEACRPKKMLGQVDRRCDEDAFTAEWLMMFS